MEEQPEPPKALLEKPVLYQDLYPVWECFWFLHQSRPVGMDVGAILLSEIITYWRDVAGITDRGDIAEKVRLIRAMDEVFLKHNRERANAV